MSSEPHICVSALIPSYDTMTPKRRPVAWLMRLMEEIYDHRYARDAAELREEEEVGEKSDVEKQNSLFPVFVIEFFSKRYGLRQLVDQTCWDLLYNVHLLRDEFPEIEVFAKFLEVRSHSCQ